MAMRRSIPISAVLLAAAWCVLAWNARAETGWSITAYGGRMTDGSLAESASLSTGLLDSYLAALAISRECMTWGEKAALEVEGQIVKHFGDQKHFELNGLVIARWRSFPWDEFLETSLAAGEGLSYATDVPEVEVRQYGKSARLLNYLLFELTVGLPQVERWSLVTRIHHRSGVFGAFDGVLGASNFICFGAKYRF